MKIEIDIPEKELYFLDVPPIYKNFMVLDYLYAGVWLMESDSKELNHWKVRLPRAKYEVLGFVKDVIIGEIQTDKNFVLRIIKS